MTTGIPYTGRSYSAAFNERCDVGLSELEAMSVLASPRLRAGDELLGHNPCYGTVFESVTGLVISDGGWCLSKVRCGVFPFGRTASILLGTCSPGLGMVFTRYRPWLQRGKS